MATQKQQQEFQDFKDNIQALRTRITEIGSKFLNDNCKDIFAKYPDLISISWVAYTPYFNDGDTCYYRSRHNHPNLEGDLKNYSEIRSGYLANISLQLSFKNLLPISVILVLKACILSLKSWNSCCCFCVAIITQYLFLLL
jgi:hypothetical protein